MAQLNIHLEKTDLLLFKQKVGYGNVSESIRNYIQACIDKKEDETEKQIVSKMNKLKGNFEQYNALKTKLKKIEIKKQIEEEKKQKLEEEQKRRWKKAEGQMMKDHLHRVV